MYENMPGIDSVEDVNDAFWDRRFEEINAFEKHIADNGTIIFKFFLNLSKDEQKNRLLRRLNRPDKQWKFSSDDLKERKLWDKYQMCYEEVLNRSSKVHAPWFNIPADDKPAARYIVAKILYDTLKQYTDIKEPELPANEKENIDLYKQELENEN
jgi:polyphosphate kinase 2 (PPK2 family)